jgi:hypothetical protein
MKRYLLLGTALCLFAVGAASAQESSDGPARRRDLFTKPIIAAPESGVIVVSLGGDPTRVYFKRSLKSITIDDDLLVKATPQSDHVVSFAGLAPGKSSLSIESADGSRETWGVVSVVHELHEVRIHRPSNRNGRTGELSQDSTNRVGGYVSIYCNEMRCDDESAPK